jgi:hypothetical protein
VKPTHSEQQRTHRHGKQKKNDLKKREPELSGSGKAKLQPLTANE